jgi:hypothetical protein
MAIPMIGTGMDLNAIVKVMLPHLFGPSEGHEARKRGQASEPMAIDKDALNSDLAELPSQPDERLK